MTRSISDSRTGPSRFGVACAALALAACSSAPADAPSGGSGGSGSGAQAGTSGAGGGGTPGAGGSLQGTGSTGSKNTGGARSSYGGGGGTGPGGAGPGGATGQGGGPFASAGGSFGAGGAPGGGAGGTLGEGGAPGSAGGAPGGGGALWRPTAGTTWQWQLTDDIDTSVDVAVYDIDGFDTDASTVATLHGQGRKVICYLSVGSYEDWRPDAGDFPESALGNEYPGWPGERFVDIRSQGLRDVMTARFDLCKAKGFDGIEPDNMDVYGNDSGFPLTESDGLDYAKWIAREAHARGLNVGQKNASELAAELEPSFDWMLTEDCYDQGWCDEVAVYVDHDKPVFMSEYTDTGVDFGEACSWGKPKKFSPILKGRDLDAPVEFCR